MRKAVLRGLIAHKLRLALTALAIVLGVGFVTGTLILTDTIRSVFDELFTDVTENIDLYVRSGSAFEATMGFVAQRDTVDEELLERIAAVEGVAAAGGNVGGYAQIVRPDGEPVTTTGAPMLGVSWSDDEMSPFRLRDGRGPRRDGEIAVDAATASQHDLSVGDEVTVLLPGPAEEFTIVGITGFGVADNLAGATMTAFELSTAQRVFNKQGGLDEIGVAGEPGVEVDVLRERIEAVLPAGVEVVDAEAFSDELTAQVAEGIGFFTIALLVFGGVALFVGAFIIFNTFTIIIAQRTREFALLRALGASGRQVLVAVVAEAAVLGVVASVLGIAFGFVMAAALRALLDAGGMGMPTGDLVLLPRTLIVGFVIGIGVTVLASILPARRASQTPPVAAMRDEATEDTVEEGSRVVGGLPVVTLGMATLFAGLRGATATPPALVAAGALCIFVGAAILAPAVSRPVSRMLGWPFLRLFGITGKLARENASRNPRRTAATAAALMIGLALVSFVAVFAESAKLTTDRVLDDALGADFILTTGSAFGPPGAPINPQLSEDLAARPELGAVTGVRLGQFRLDETTMMLIAADPTVMSRLLNPQVQEGSLEAIADGGVLVSRDQAEELGVAVGDTLPMEFSRTGAHDIPVRGIFEGDAAMGAGFITSLTAYDTHFTEPIDLMILAAAAPGVDVDEARAAVESEIEAYPTVELSDQSEFRAAARENLNQLLLLVSALLGLAIIIALLGITNTLALSILERTRELGLLRAVGMSRRQVRNLVRWEAMVVALLGAALGVPIGLFFGWAVVEGLRDQGLEVFAAPWGTLAIYTATAGVAGVIAAILPARRAARLDVLRAVTVD